MFSRWHSVSWSCDGQGAGLRRLTTLLPTLGLVSGKTLILGIWEGKECKRKVNTARKDRWQSISKWSFKIHIIYIWYMVFFVVNLKVFCSYHSKCTYCLHSISNIGWCRSLRSAQNSLTVCHQDRRNFLNLPSHWKTLFKTKVSQMTVQRVNVWRNSSPSFAHMVNLSQLSQPESTWLNLKIETECQPQASPTRPRPRSAQHLEACEILEQYESCEGAQTQRRWSMTPFLTWPNPESLNGSSATQILLSKHEKT